MKNTTTTQTIASFGLSHSVIAVRFADGTVLHLDGESLAAVSAPEGVRFNWVKAQNMPSLFRGTVEFSLLGAEPQPEEAVQQEPVAETEPVQEEQPEAPAVQEQPAPAPVAAPEPQSAVVTVKKYHTITVSCHRCGGTGRTPFLHVEEGKCFACHGRGTRDVKELLGEEKVERVAATTTAKPALNLNQTNAQPKRVNVRELCQRLAKATGSSVMGNITSVAKALAKLGTKHKITNGELHFWGKEGHYVVVF